jgi:serine/threonine protein kinase
MLSIVLHLEHVFIYFKKCIVLDKIGELVGSGAVALIYSALLKETNVQKAVKCFFTDNVFSIKRDMSIGFELRLKTEYTLNYEDTFVVGKLQCVVMKFMKTSLKEFLDPYINSSPKKYLSDEVCSYLCFILFCF